MQRFLDHTKCPSSYVQRITCSQPSGKQGFFTVGELRVYGRTNGGVTSRNCAGHLIAVDSSISRTNGSIVLPFDATEIIDNLRLEKYCDAINEEITNLADKESTWRSVYYALRPFFPVPLRRILQRFALRDWAKLPFPAWPLDTTVEDFISWLWVLVLEASEEKEIPFIWYWPKGFQACAIMTHDVETGEGQEFCHKLLEVEMQYGIKSSFELVPEVRYKISEQVMGAIRKAGSEICVHGLNHDGRLFDSEQVFRDRAKAINQYAEAWGAKGFRSPIMYRNLAWYDAFKFSYDMSVPNVAHLDPQHGGCCTVFPFFVGNVVELPLTTIQDYPLYNILRVDPMTMWTNQMDLIIAKHGLVSFIVHPDYTMEPNKQKLYCQLLDKLKTDSERRNIWLALPHEVDTWWRDRNSMTLTQKDGKWSIRGKGSERAAVAYARLEDGKLTYIAPNGSTDGWRSMVDSLQHTSQVCGVRSGTDV